MRLITFFLLILPVLSFGQIPGRFPQNPSVLKFGRTTEAKGVITYQGTKPSYDPSTRWDAYDYVDTTNYAYYKFQAGYWNRANVIYQDTTPTPIYVVDDAIIREYTSDWYRPSDSTYFVFSTKDGFWKPKNGIYRSHTAPTDNGIVKYSDSYWYDTVNDKLKLKRGSVWYQVGVTEVSKIPTLNDTTTLTNPTTGYFAYVEEDSSLQFYINKWYSVKPGSAIADVIEVTPLISSDRNKIYRDPATTDSLTYIFDARVGDFRQVKNENLVSSTSVFALRKFAVGEVVRTAGFASAADLGGSEYEIKATGTADNITVFATADGRFAHLIAKNGEIDIRQVGAVPDDGIDDYDEINALINYSPVKRIVFTGGKYQIGTNVTLVDSKEYVFQPGAYIDTPTSATTVTVGGFSKIKAGRQKIFGDSISLIIRTTEVDQVYPEWFGVVPEYQQIYSGNYDTVQAVKNTVAFQKLISSFRPGPIATNTQYQITIKLASAVYPIKGQIYIDKGRTVNWEGSGNHESAGRYSALVWAGAVNVADTSLAMLRYNNVGFVKIRNIALIGKSTSGRFLSAAIMSERTNDSGGDSPRRFTIEDVEIKTFTHGIYTGPPGSLNGNNDFFTLNKIRITGCAYGIRVRWNQAVSWNISNYWFSGGTLYWGEGKGGASRVNFENVYSNAFSIGSVFKFDGAADVYIRNYSSEYLDVESFFQLQSGTQTIICDNCNFSADPLDDSTSGGNDPGGVDVPGAFPGDTVYLVKGMNMTAGSRITFNSCSFGRVGNAGSFAIEATTSSFNSGAKGAAITFNDSPSAGALVITQPNRAVFNLIFNQAGSEPRSLNHRMVNNHPLYTTDDNGFVQLSSILNLSSTQENNQSEGLRLGRTGRGLPYELQNITYRFFLDTFPEIRVKNILHPNKLYKGLSFFSGNSISTLTGSVLYIGIDGDESFFGRKATLSGANQIITANRQFQVLDSTDVVFRLYKEITAATARQSNDTVYQVSGTGFFTSDMVNERVYIDTGDSLGYKATIVSYIDGQTVRVNKNRTIPAGTVRVERRFAQSGTVDGRPELIAFSYEQVPNNVAQYGLITDWWTSNSATVGTPLATVEKKDSVTTKTLGGVAPTYAQKSVVGKVSSFPLYVGLFSDRPTLKPTNKNYFYFASDQNKMYRWDGLDWINTNAASLTDYDNSTSGLAATNSQSAIDEIEGRVQTNEGNISTNDIRLDSLEAGFTSSVSLRGTPTIIAVSTSNSTVSHSHSILSNKFSISGGVLTYLGTVSERVKISYNVTFSCSTPKDVTFVLTRDLVEYAASDHTITTAAANKYSISGATTDLIANGDEIELRLRIDSGTADVTIYNATWIIEKAY